MWRVQEIKCPVLIFILYIWSSWDTTLRYVLYTVFLAPINITSIQLAILCLCCILLQCIYSPYTPPNFTLAFMDKMYGSKTPFILATLAKQAVKATYYEHAMMLKCSFCFQNQYYVSHWTFTIGSKRIRDIIYIQIRVWWWKCLFIFLYEGKTNICYQ